MTGVQTCALPISSAAAWGIQPVRDGSVLAIDPDIPLRAQQLHLRGPAGQWLMDGRSIGSGSAVWWPMTPGKHVLELRDAQRQVIDKLAFEVRPSALRRTRTLSPKAPAG